MITDEMIEADIIRRYKSTGIPIIVEQGVYDLIEDEEVKKCVAVSLRL